jgi:hypothetical protein
MEPEGSLPCLLNLGLFKAETIKLNLIEAF